jgi:hypothetical protein
MVSESEKKQNNKDRDRTQPLLFDAYGFEVEPDKAANKAEDNKHPSKPRRKTSFWFNVVSNIISAGLLVVTAYLAHYAVKQWQTMVEQTALARIATCASAESARAAKSAADTADKTLKMTQRSSVDLGGWVLSKSPIDGLVDVTFNLINTGHSPARLVQIDYGSRAGAPLPDVPKYVFTKILNSYQLHPGRSLSSTITLNNIKHERLMSIRPDYWYFVKARYRDAFGPHTSCAVVKYEFERSRLAIYTEAPKYNCGD